MGNKELSFIHRAGHLALPIEFGKNLIAYIPHFKKGEWGGFV
jgi:hypothetical protein